MNRFMAKPASNSNSRRVAGIIPIFSTSENINSISKGKGIPLGRTSRYSLLLNIDLDTPPNPHVSIVGMTGSGKTHLLKAIVIGTSLLENKHQAIIDWNGEYSCLTKELGGSVISPTKGGMCKASHNGLVCFNLSKLSEADSRIAADGILNREMALAKASGFSNRVNRILFLDEAWKLMHDKGVVESVFREARKYGMSIIAASQMFGDITNEVIANSSTIFLFSLQNPADLESISNMHLFNGISIDQIKNLGTGECASLTYQEPGVKCEAIIKIFNLAGIKILHLRSGSSDIMTSEKSIKKIAARLGIKDNDISYALSLSIDGDYLDVLKMAKILLNSSVPIGVVVAFMRLAGVNDVDTAKVLSNIYSINSG